MSLVENIVSQISTKGLGGITKPSGFDMNDDTFEKILQSIGNNAVIMNDKLQALGNLGQPSGMIIESFDDNLAVKPIGQDTQNIINKEPVKIKDVDLGDNYFSNLLKESPKEHKGLMNAAIKHAASAYNTFGRELVENLTEFAKDITSKV